jgi:amino acid adenylation domain-containing protein
LKKQQIYWRKQFAGDVPVLALPTDFPRPEIQSFNGNRVPFEIDSNTVRELKTLAVQEGVTLFMVLLAAVNVLLGKITRQTDIVVGTVVAGRKNPDLEPIIGMFANTLPLRNHIKPGKTCKDFLKKIGENTLNALENQDYPFEELVEQLKLNKDTGRNPLFDVMFLLQNKELFGAAIGNPVSIRSAGLILEPHPYETHIAKFDLTVEAVEVEEKLAFTFEYCTKLFKKPTIQRFTTYFRKIITDIIENRGRKLSDMEIISPGEKQKILFEFNDTTVEYPENKTIQQLFTGQAERIPDHISLVGSMQITYGELNLKSNQLACRLKGKGVTGAGIVPLMVERSLEMLVGILGILKAGAAYLPIEPSYPGERIKYILKDSDARLVLSQKTPAEKLNEEYEVMNLENPGLYTGNGSRPHSGAVPGDQAYVIYTSGSTGNPKGVLLEHGPVVNLLYALKQRYPLTGSDTYLFKTPYVFDVSVTELFGWFLGGGRLKILGTGDEKDPGKIIAAVEKEKVTHINFVPSMFNSLVDRLEQRDTGKLSSLKYIFLAGEALLPELVNKFRALNTGILLENLYGPTEAAVYSSYYPLSAWSGGNVPIGKPMPNVRLYILDMENRFQPIGVSGELCITGNCLGRGYLNNPELTAERFFAFSNRSNRSYRSYSSKKLYKTGDMACWRPDGNIDFLGRNDQQVKIRGYRIEPGEIENRLLKEETVKEAVVMVRCDSSGDKTLCAYVVPRSPGNFKIPLLRTHLKEKLPAYMIPAHFVPLEEMPLTASGKIDKKSLPGVKITAGEAYTAPRDEDEKVLLEIWCEVLFGGEAPHTFIGIDDNFFELGGHSLKATVLAAKIHQKLKVDVSLGDVFKYPTVRGLAHYVRGSARKIFTAIKPAEKKLITRRPLPRNVSIYYS